ncbi:MAG: 4Fe-4S binding protein [Proteobacteria bacterium]|nr:4Fe-4S binding protein [Pseudomonadota bacterium]
MRLNGKTVLLCNCEGSMNLNGEALAEACGADAAFPISSHLCRAQIETFKAAVRAGGPVVVACTQEAPLFSEVAAEVTPDTAVNAAAKFAPSTAANFALGFTNIRERAGWSQDADHGNGTAKIAALLAEAALNIAPTPSVTLQSEGRCVVYGNDEMALDAAAQLADRLDVMVLLHSGAEVPPPRVTRVPLLSGDIVRATGHLGAFDLAVRQHATASVSSRARLVFAGKMEATTLQCDLILDLSGGPALFPGDERRDGYLRPDRGNPAAVQKALYDLSGMVGEFEKPIYVSYDAELCVHSRSQIVGCSRCLDNCPTAAIQPDGDHVKIDPFVCGGCGHCSSVCPTGAASYALPAAATVAERLRTLLLAYFKAGGSRPALLLHNPRYGDELISILARHGRGLPANVLPFPLNEVTQIGLDFLLAALGYGAVRVFILPGPGKAEESAALMQQVSYADALTAGLGHGDSRIMVLDQTDPSAIETALYEHATADSLALGSFLASGGRRTVTALALQQLHRAAPEPVEEIALPAGATYGAIQVDTDNCTLCLSCVSACPTGAIMDNPASPKLSFMEAACVQCGLCRNTCPEKVIQLQPRYNFANSARQAVTLKEEEPFACIRCGKPFGVKSSIEAVMEKLAGKHSMFQSGAAIERIKMCDNCRVVAQMEDGEFNAGPQRPLPRTTEDDLREREIQRQRAALKQDYEAGKADDD